MVKFLLLAYPFTLFSKMTMKKFFLNRPIQMNSRTSATISRTIKLLGMIISLCGHQNQSVVSIIIILLIFCQQKVFLLINLKWQSSFLSNYNTGEPDIDLIDLFYYYQFFPNISERFNARVSSQLSKMSRDIVNSSLDLVISIQHHCH